jgi:radical SAM family uncharacterized protein
MLKSTPPPPTPTPAGPLVLASTDRTVIRRATEAAVPPSVWHDLEPWLIEVTKPAQYVGGEHNAVSKDWASCDTRWAVSYPDTYEVGQPNQGIQILYEVLNERATTLAERTYNPWIDLEEVMRREGIPAFTLEQHRPVWAFDVLAVTLPHELGHTNLLNLIDLAGIPIHAAERTADHPIVLVGGHAAYNPEPLAPFIDAAVMGDGEQVTLDIDDVIRAWKHAGNHDRDALLHALAKVEGVYVPALFEAQLTPDGRLRQTIPSTSGLARRVPKRTIQDLEEWQYPVKQIVPLTEVVHERFSVEIFRGCTRGCRFCQAGMITRPVRERKPETVRKMVTEGIKDTGFEEVGLLSLSSADHSGIADIARTLADDFEGTATGLSLPSTRVDAFNVTLSNELARNGRRTGLTFAPEAGSERMRQVINKMVSEEDMMRTADIAFANGWRHVKLYFMVGLPTETDEDVLAIAEMGAKVGAIARNHRGRNKVTVSVGGFVPKPHTPFQWVSQDTPDDINRKLKIIRDHLRDHRGVTLRTNAPDEGVIEGLLARGGREAAPIVEGAWRRGARMDGWQEIETLELWHAAAAEVGIDLYEHIGRERGEDEALPWDHLDSGLEKSWLWKDWLDAASDKELDDCRWSACYDCGVCPGLDVLHDTGYGYNNVAYEGDEVDAQGRKALPIAQVTSGPLGGDQELPTSAERYAAGVPFGGAQVTADAGATSGGASS